ncbi:alpha/beta fold hydrolase [Erythrobacter sp. HA6-11]
MDRLFRSLLIAVLASFISACSNLAGSPLTASQSTEDSIDPAVELANEMVGETDAFRSGFIGAGEDRIHYVEAGSGPPIVMVHGFPSFWFVWFDQMAALRQCYRVIAIDAPGANLSAKPTDPAYYRIGNLARRLDTVIAELSPSEKVTLVGHDWGGALAWSYAEKDASRIAKLVVFSAPPQDLLLEMLRDNPEQRARSGYMERFHAITRERIVNEAIHESLFEIGYRGMLDREVLSPQEGEAFRRAVADPDAVHAGMEWYRANIPLFDEIDLERDAWPYRGAATDVPVLLIRGENDRTFVKEMGALASAHAPNLTIETIAGVGHWTQFEKPAQATSLLKEFLGSNTRGCP